MWLVASQEASWISLPHASKAVHEMTSYERPDSECKIQVYNLAHPKPVKWNTIMSTISSKLSLPQSSPIPYSAWLEKVRALRQDNRTGTTASDNGNGNIGVLTLLPFFESVKGHMTDGAKEGAIGVTMALSKAKQASRTLSGDDLVLPQLGEEDMENWIGYWKKAGLLS
jgi:hypothetical protein